MSYEDKQHSCLDPFKIKRILVTHIDLDGISPIVLSMLYHIKFDLIYTWNYSDINVTELINLHPEEIIMTDLSFEDENDMKKIIDTGIKIRVFDHHKTSEYLSKYDGCIVDMNRCGTKIFYEEYIKPFLKSKRITESSVVTEYVELVDIFDRWQNENSNWNRALDLNRFFDVIVQMIDDYHEDIPKRLLSMIPANNILRDLDRAMIMSEMFNPFILVTVLALRVYKLPERYVYEYHKAVATIVRMEKAAYGYATKSLVIKEMKDGVKYGICKGMRFPSIVMNEILKKNKDMTFLIGVYGSGKMSVRAKSPFDLTTIPLFRGHPQACGGKIDSDKINLLFINGIESIIE